MKKRMLSIFMALTMCLTMFPTAVFAEESDNNLNSTEPPVCICETACTEEERNSACDVCGIEGAEIKDCACFKADEPSDDEQIIDETDSAVAAAQELIDALPTIDTVTAADYDAVQDAYDVYLELTEEQQAKISGAVVFEELFGWFNEQTARWQRT